MVQLDFNKIIEQHLHREQKPKEFGRYYPSEIGSCLRKVFYSYKYPMPADPQLVKIFEVGNIMHHFVAEVMRSDRQKDVKLLESEMPFKLDEKEFVVSGRIDDLLLVLAEGEKVLVEVKSTAALQWTTAPQPWHVMQLQLYMHATGVHKGAVLYIEKGTLQCKTFMLDYDPAIAEEALARFRLLHDNLKNNRTPKPEARLRNHMNWMCRKCEYRSRCFEETPESEILNYRWP